MTWLLLVASVLNGQTNAAPILISLSRTACFGTCPEYTVKMTGDGSVTYNGEKFVRVDGVHEWKIDPATVRALADEMLKKGFFELQDSYSSPWTDHPTVYTTLSLDGKTKTIRDYISGPPELKQIEARIDVVSGAKGYVSISGSAIRDMRKSGWRATDAQARNWLWEAARNGDADVLDALIDAGADPNTTRDDGSNLLMVAAASGDADCVRLLLGKGVDPTLRNLDGRNAADFVRTAMKPLPRGVPGVLPAAVPATGRPPQYDLILKLLTNE